MVSRFSLRGTYLACYKDKVHKVLVVQMGVGLSIIHCLSTRDMKIFA